MLQPPPVAKKNVVFTVITEQSYFPKLTRGVLFFERLLKLFPNSNIIQINISDIDIEINVLLGRDELVWGRSIIKYTRQYTLIRGYKDRPAHCNRRTECKLPISKIVPLTNPISWKTWNKRTLYTKKGLSTTRISSISKCTDPL